LSCIIFAGLAAGDPDQRAVPGAADRRRHQRQHHHQRLQQPARPIPPVLVNLLSVRGSTVRVSRLSLNRLFNCSFQARSIRFSDTAKKKKCFLDAAFLPVGSFPSIFTSYIDS
jgi:hypothetical protein